MINIFCVRPTRPNIGNDAINLALRGLLRDAFEGTMNLIQVPPIQVDGLGWHSGLRARTIHEMNLYGHGVVLGGGNLYENGQLDVDINALRQLRPPLFLCGLSYGRIYDQHRTLTRRTDAMPDDLIVALNRVAFRSVARDDATFDHLRSLGLNEVQLGACPTLALDRFLTEDSRISNRGDGVLISIRSPELMSIPLRDQARVRIELERIIKVAHSQGLGPVQLLCHDKRDMTFAASLGATDYVLPDDAQTFVGLLRGARLVITFRLHAFLPCVCLGIPSINISYDERSLSMTRTIGMGEWDIDFINESDVAAAVMQRMDRIDRFDLLLERARPAISKLKTVLDSAIEEFATEVHAYARQ